MLITLLQALAAVGQCRLMSLWDGLFSHVRVPVAQILLTRNDIADVRNLPLQSFCCLRPNKVYRQPDMSTPRIHSRNCSIWE